MGSLGAFLFPMYREIQGLQIYSEMFPSCSFPCSGWVTSSASSACILPILLRNFFLLSEKINTRQRPCVKWGFDELNEGCDDYDTC